MQHHPANLRSIPAVAVMVSGNIDLDQHSVGLDQLRDTSELMLRMSLVPVVTAAEATDRVLPILEVELTALSADKLWCAALIIRLHDHIEVLRNGQRIPAPVWEEAMIYTAERDDLADRTRLMLSNVLTTFCNTIHAANPSLAAGSASPPRAESPHRPIPRS